MKIIIFYALVGGAHISTAKKMKKLLESEHTVILVDILAKKPIWMQKLLGSSYRFMSVDFPFLWKIFFFFYQINFIARFGEWLQKNTIYKELLEICEIEKPDRLATTYFMSSIVEDLSEDLNLSKPLIVCAEWFTAPNSWFLAKNSNYLVFSDMAKSLAIKNGIKPENILQTEPILLFEESKEIELKYENSDLVLILAGGDGLPNYKSVFESLLKLQAEILEKTSFLVICGRDEKMLKFANNFCKNNPSLNIQAHGFADFVPTAIKTAKVVITKGGPGNVAEILYFQKPVLLNSYIWGQELGNVEFVEENNYGKFVSKNLDVVLTQVLENKLVFQQWQPVLDYKVITEFYSQEK
jgi:UDP-N-acetylglucosamine:LPS N-acetylglucosamine transferase